MKTNRKNRWNSNRVWGRSRQNRVIGKEKRKDNRFEKKIIREIRQGEKTEQGIQRKVEKNRMEKIESRNNPFIFTKSPFILKKSL